MACWLSDAREWFDQNIKGHPPSASAADQAANSYETHAGGGLESIVFPDLLLGIAGGFWFRHQMIIDSCLDRGGRWNYDTSGCEGARE
jgi:hypothetical protein